MNTLSCIQKADSNVNKKSFASLFSKLSMLKLVRALIPFAALAFFFPELALAAGGGSSAKDLMSSGDGTVKATFGRDSSIVKWIILAEVLVGGIMYMTTKNIKFLVGFAIVSVFFTVAMSVAGY
ncbi:type IV conjugative transfer system pilin TraA [Escherichia coli]|uniref:type IV conjugative transfer system pilin TraA n=1 Tax=Escherichia coli TaxID=562 RepID=UPI001CBB3B79|nr:type IV conjugative transfer system pilin TraA [Escherichia coli]MCD9134331.1 type IV conjugative transfer system pilin TraA [Escherichia coli]